jgi:hypothetical protein
MASSLDGTYGSRQGSACVRDVIDYQHVLSRQVRQSVCARNRLQGVSCSAGRFIDRRAHSQSVQLANAQCVRQH